MSEPASSLQKKQTERLDQVMIALNGISQTLVAIGDLPRTLEEIARSAQQVLGADLVDLYQYVQAHREFILPPTLVGERHHPFVPKVKIYEDDVVVRAVKLGQPQYIKDAQGTTLLTGKFEVSRDDAPDKRFVIREGIVSSAIVPLKVARETVGVMFVNYRTPRTFDKEQKALVRSFANLAAVAIHNARLFERRRQADMLQEVARIVNAALSLELEQVIQLVLEQLRRVIEYHTASVQMIQGDRRTRVSGVGFSTQDYPAILRRNISEDALISQIVQDQQTVVLSDVRESALWDAIPETSHIGSWIGAPLVFNDQVIGLLTLDHTLAGYYTQDSGELVTAFANHVAVAVHNSTQAQALAEINRLTQRSISMIDESAENTRDLLQQVADSALDLLKADIIDLYEYVQRRDHFELPQIFAGDRLVRGVPKDVIQADDVVRRLIRKKKPLYVKRAQAFDVLSAPFTVDRVGKHPERFVVREKLQSTAIIPLRTRDETVGLLFAGFRTPQLFLTEQQELVELFANQAATVIRNARLMADLKRQAAGHQTLNSVGAKLMEETSEEAILDIVARSAAKTLDCTHCSVFCLEGANLLVGASKGNRGESLPPGKSFRVGQGVAGWVARKGQSALVRDTLKDKRFERGWSAPQPDPRSLVVVPITLEGKIYGAISAEHDQMGAFDEHDQLLLETLASQASQAIRNARLCGIRERLDAQLESLHRVVQEQSLEEALCRTVEGISTILGKEASTSINQYDQATGSFGRSYAYGPLQKELETPPRASGTGMHVVTTKEPLYMADVLNPPRGCPPVRDEAIQIGVKSFAAIPLKPKDNVVGVLFVNLRTPLSFSDEIKRILELFAGRAAIAIENARLYEHISQDLERKIREQKALIKIGQTVSTLGIDDILDLVYDQASQIMNLSDALFYIALYNEETGMVRFGLAVEKDNNVLVQQVRWGETAEGARDDKWGERARRTPPGLTEYIIREYRPLLVPAGFKEWAEDHGVSVWSRIGAKNRPTRSWLGVPMLVGTKMVGVISVQSLERENEFDAGHCELLATFANQAAVAIENARLYTEVLAQQAKIANVENLLVRNQIAADLVHRLNNMLGTIPVRVGLILENLDNPDARGLVLRNLQGVTEDANRVMTRARQLQLTPQPEDIDDLCEMLGAIMEEAALEARRPIEKHLKCPSTLPTIYTVRINLANALRFVIDNAIEAMQAEGGHLQIVVEKHELTTDRQEVEIRISDDGVPIPPDIRSKIFQAGVTHKEGGTGYGLWRARNLVEMTGGSLEFVDPAPGERIKTFRFHIPVQPESKT